MVIITFLPVEILETGQIGSYPGSVTAELLTAFTLLLFKDHSLVWWLRYRPSFILLLFKDLSLVSWLRYRPSFILLLFKDLSLV